VGVQMVLLNAKGVRWSI